MQQYNTPGGVVSYIDGRITQSQLQDIQSAPFQLYPNPSGKTIPIFFNLIFRMEITNVGLGFNLFVTTSYNLATFGQTLGQIDIVSTQQDSYYVIQPSMSGIIVDSPFYTATALSSDNNLILTSNTNDPSRFITRDIEYRLFYSLLNV